MSATTPVEELKKKIEELKKIASLPREWNKKLAKSGQCSRDHYGEDKGNAIPVMSTDQYSYCEEHWNYYGYEEVEKAQKEIKTLEGELQFRDLIGKITRFSQVKDLVKAVSVILKKQKDAPWDKKEHIFTQEDKTQGLRLLRLLAKIRPQSSQFLDKGVAINKDLFLAGTVEEPTAYSHTVRGNIILTALDQDERYKSIARVGLTFQEAERLRNLLVDCLEHVRIEKMVLQIQEAMKISLPEEEKDEEP